MTLSTQLQTIAVARKTRRSQREPAYSRSLVELADQYLRLVDRKRRPNTVLNYSAHLRRFVNWLQAEQGADVAGKISPTMIEVYGEMYKLLEQTGKYKASTVNNHLNPVRGFIRWLIAEAAVFDHAPDTGEPWITETRVNQWLADVPDTSRPMRKERALNADEVRNLLDAIADPRDRALFTLLVGSGLRVSEACALRAGDIQIRPDGAAIVHVLDGKGGKPRQVVIADTVLGPIYAWSLKCDLRLGDTADTRPLWPAHQGEGCKSLSRIRVYQLLQSYAARAGLNCHISPHSLRHTYGTERYRAERDPVSVAEALGHSGLAYIQTYVKSVESAEAAPFKPSWEEQ